MLQKRKFNIYIYYLLIMIQVYSKHQRPYDSQIQRCYKNINSDYFGEQQSINQRTSSTHSRMRSINRTELSSQKSKSRNRKLDTIDSAQKLNYNIKKINILNKKVQILHKANKKTNKNDPNQKNSTIKKLTVQMRDKSIKRLQKMETKTKPSSRDDTDQYFGSFNSDKKSMFQIESLKKSLEKKALQSFKQLKKKTSLNDPEFKKRQIQEYLKKQKSLTCLFQKTQQNFDWQQRNPTLSDRQTSLLMNNEIQNKIDGNENGCTISNVLQGYNEYIRVSNEELEQVNQNSHYNISIMQDINLNRESKSSSNENNSNISQFLNIESNYKDDFKNKFESIESIMNGVKSIKVENKYSCINVNHRQNMQYNTIFRIQKHIKRIERLIEFIGVQMNNIYVKQTNYLNFLVFKKYIIERLKIEQSLDGKMNCFIMKGIEIQTSTLKQMIKRGQFKKLNETIKTQNKNIINSFQFFFHDKYDSTYLDIKNVHYLNKTLIKQLNKQFLNLSNSIKKIKIKSNTQNINQTIIWIIQITYMIQQLNGNYIKDFNQFQTPHNLDSFLYQNITKYRKQVEKYNN